jgi:hypothetical protein
VLGVRKTIAWIEKLHDKPLDDFRKYCIWRVFAPYFINIKGLSGLETFNAIKSWLDKCNSVRKLDFNPERKINEELHRVRNFRPIRQDQLKEENNLLYLRLKTDDILL